MDRPITTLYMLSSVDGKISTGSSNELDVDKDYPKINGVKEGLHQYYEIEKTTDLWSLNSGLVQAKIGANTKDYPDKTPVSFVLIDNKHLSEHGVRYFCSLAKTFVLVTTNKNHPAFKVNEDNLHILYQEKLDLKKMLEELYTSFDCKRITIQSGGTLNSLFLREKLFDFVDIIYAPVLIGGWNTPSLIDGDSITDPKDLDKLGVLEVTNCEVLENSYVRLRYKVVG